MDNSNYIALPVKRDLPYNPNDPATTYLTPRVLDLLEEGLKINEPFYFTYGSLDTHLHLSFPNSSKGERTGVLHTVLNSDSRITKLSRGAYQISKIPILSGDSYMKVLDETIDKLEKLSLNVPTVADTTSRKENRRLLQSVGHAIDTLHDLQKKFHDDKTNDLERYN